MTTNEQDEAARQNAERMQQEQAERDFVAAREQLAAEDALQRAAEQEREAREQWLAVIKAQQTNSANENRPLSFDDLQEHPAHVLDRVIAPNTSTELLQAAYTAAADVKRFAETADLGGTENEALELLLYAHADNIQDEIRAMLESRGVFIPQDPINQNTPEHLAAVPGSGAPQEPGTAQPEALTLEAIERDPWNAVNLPIPDNADCEFLEVIAGTAGKLADAKAAEMSEMMAGHREGDPLPAGYDAAEDAHMAADTRAMEAEDALEELACLTQEDGGKQPDAPEIAPADSFHMAADAATNTRTLQEQQERGIAERIAFLEGHLGSQDSRTHHAYVAAQRDYGDRIADAAPGLAAFLMVEKLAHSQDYAADLCQGAAARESLEGNHEQAAYLNLEGRTRHESADQMRGAGPENSPPDRGDEAGKDANIADTMAAAAAEMVGGKFSAAFVVEGPNGEQQQGQQAQGPALTGEPRQSNYAALRGIAAELEAMPEPFVYEDAPTRPENSWLIAPVLTTEGTATVRQPGNGSRQEAEIVSVNGKAQEADRMEAAEEIRVAESSEKAKREEASGAKDAELGTSTSEAAKEAAARPLSRAERAQQDAAEYAADAERGQESGHAIATGGRGGR